MRIDGDGQAPQRHDFASTHSRVTNLAVAPDTRVMYFCAVSNTSQPRASLIIPTFYREEALVECIWCALNQDYSPLEILVVDQTPAHDDATKSFLNSVKEKISLIHHSPPSAVTARNVGLELAKGDVLIFIDDDTTFDTNFVTAHVEAHQRGADVVQGRVIEEGRGVASRAQWMKPWLRVVGSNTHDRPGVTNTITGCNFSISRRVVEVVGQFDTRFTGLMLREDADYGARCHKASFNMRFDPAASVLHHRKSTGGVDFGTREISRQFEPSVLRNDLYFARKHFGPFVVWLYKHRLHRRLRKEQRSLSAQAGIPFKTLISEADAAAIELLNQLS